MFYFFLLFISSNLLIYGQEKSGFEIRKQSAVYFELFGNSASFFSVNYDRIIKQYKKGYFNTSIGFAPYISKDNYYTKGFNIPVSLNYSYGERNGHLEVGFGLGLNRAIDDEKNADFLRLLGNIRLGYKYQKASGGIFFKAGFTPIVPIYYFYGNIPKWSMKDAELFLGNSFSLAIGYSF